jgi:transposase
MDTINRRKPRQYKGRNSTPGGPRKTDRKELTPLERAFVCGAVLVGNATHQNTADTVHCSKSTVTRTVNGVKRKAEEAGLDITDSILYENELGRGRPELLTPAQKERVIQIVTQDRAHREKES